MRFTLFVALIITVVAVVAVSLAANVKTNQEQQNRGAYIVNRVALCVDCHNARNRSGTINEKRVLSGAPVLFKPKVKMPWADYAPNLTPAGFLKRWSDKELARFLMTGVDPPGHIANPPMPQFRLNEQDAKAVTAYLRNLPPIADSRTIAGHHHIP